MQVLTTLGTQGCGFILSEGSPASSLWCGGFNKYKYKYKCEDDIPYWSTKTNISQKCRKPVTADCVGEGVKAGLASAN